MNVDALKKLIARRHPEYNKLLEHWNFLELCYDGARDWFDTNIFRYLKEGEGEFKDRIERAYRFNHSKEVVDLVGKYIFKSKIHRNYDEAPKEIVEFWKQSNRSGSSPIQKFIRQLEKKSSVFGRIWVVVDSTPDDRREYAYVVKPQHVLDMSYDDNDNLNWILIMETARDDEDPFASSGNINERYRLWTKTSWVLINVETLPGTNEVKIEIIGSGDHDLGVVPVFAHDHNDSEELYSSPSLICDIAYLDRACANYLSNLDAIIQDQTFSQLAMPAQGLLPGTDTHTQMVEAGTKRIFTYDGEGGAQPFFLSPDIKQAEIIITVVGKIINEIYHTVGMAGERTKQDNSIGIDNSSGVAKSIDFERVNALLATKAAALRRAEIRMMELVLRWNGVEFDTDKLAELVIYPETFDVRGIADEFTIASNLTLIEAPTEMRKEQLRVLVDKIFPRLKADIKEKILKEINNLTEESFMMGMLGAKESVDPAKLTQKGNRQGEVTKGTPEK
ncbi:MAG: hypothetical protein ACXWT0_01685 [Methylobacter sp.]